MNCIKADKEDNKATSQKSITHVKNDLNRAINGVKKIYNGVGNVIHNEVEELTKHLFPDPQVIENKNTTAMLEAEKGRWHTASVNNSKGEINPENIGSEGTGKASQPTQGKCNVYTLSGSSNEEKMWNYFTQYRNLSEITTAGVMGNIKQESGFDPFKGEAGGGGLGVNSMDTR